MPDVPALPPDAVFSVLVLTAPPPGLLSEAGGPFIKVDGKEVLLRAAELFINRPQIRQILVVFEDDELERARQRFGSHFAFTGIKTVAGGPRWLDQFTAAADKLLPETTHVLVHDAARCVVPYTDIDAVLQETAACESAVGLVTPVRSVLVEVGDAAEPLAYHLPNQYVQLLTPQGFTRAEFEKVAATKQETHARQIRLVKGSPLNTRSRGPGDERMIQTLLTMLPAPVKAGDGPFAEARW